MDMGKLSPQKERNLYKAVMEEGWEPERRIREGQGGSRENKVQFLPPQFKTSTILASTSPSPSQLPTCSSATGRVATCCPPNKPVCSSLLLSTVIHYHLDLDWHYPGHQDTGLGKLHALSLLNSHSSYPQLKPTCALLHK